MLFTVGCSSLCPDYTVITPADARCCTLWRVKPEFQQLARGVSQALLKREQAKMQGERLPLAQACAVRPDAGHRGMVFAQRCPRAPELLI